MDFSAPEAGWAHAVRSRRRRGVLAGWARCLKPTQLAFMRGVDVHRTIRAIAADVARQELPNGVSTAALERFGRSLFRRCGPSISSRWP